MTHQELKDQARMIWGTVSGHLEGDGARIAVRNVTAYKKLCMWVAERGLVAAPNTGRFPQLVKITRSIKL